MVGAVIVRGGTVVGEGWHAAYGESHAEVAALAAAGEKARGATVYVTLEPCNHTGQTPPCAPALIAAGVSRVVFAARDPNPVAAGGAEALRSAGVAVDEGIAADEARELNAAFHTRFLRERPFITLKLAMSIDGAIAAASGPGRWLTGPRARRMVHQMRAGHDAIAIGSGTALVDDPKLTVRGVRPPRVAPVRIVFDRRGRLNAGSQLVRTAGKYPTLVVTADPPPASSAALVSQGVGCITASSLAAGLRALRVRGIDSVLCEGGASFAGALLAVGAVDRLVIFQAPVLLGAGALPAFVFPPASAPASLARWRVVGHKRVGEDFMTVYAPDVSS
jgi:diaminohydroxyphosphoribosylaminopyrimidine deaminase/5-amino-6-(5-phosphoribosylamino)uracil reductase